MSQTIDRKRLAWLMLGVLIGFALTVCLPSRPLHAVATHGQDGFALATGPIDNNVEGVYFLDFLTGDLKGAVLNVNNGKFTTFYATNVLKDLQVDPAKNPKFLMVTGVAQLRGRSMIQPSQADIFIMEANSGVLAAYTVPWPGGRVNVAGVAPQFSPFVLLDVTKLRAAEIRP